MYEKFFAKHIKRGRLNVHFAGQLAYSVGEGDPSADWFIADSATLRRIMKDPHLALGEAYMDGKWTVGEGGLLRLLQVIMINFPEHEPRDGLGVMGALQKAFQQLNRIGRSYRNISHHYDLDESLFRKFLDRDMYYSCAYFERPGITLEQAQQAKCRLIMQKLNLEPGHTVLDIGCGWGGLALYLAEHADVRVTGITLSREQLRVAQERAHKHGLDKAVQFKLEDYRQHRGCYDRIVSVGMFEHVGRPYYRRFFDQVRELLTERGVALLHTIGRFGPPGTTNAWYRKYIFPGGYIPALSEVSLAAETTGLINTDTEILRLHYAETLAAWGARFAKQRQNVAKDMGERFCRMWEFYLASSEASFRWWDLVVFHIQLARELDAVPITRDYLYAPVRGELSDIASRRSVGSSS